MHFSRYKPQNMIISESNCCKWIILSPFYSFYRAEIANGNHMTKILSDKHQKTSNKFSLDGYVIANVHFSRYKPRNMVFSESNCCKLVILSPFYSFYDAEIANRAHMAKIFSYKHQKPQMRSVWMDTWLQKRISEDTNHKTWSL